MLEESSKHLRKDKHISRSSCCCLSQLSQLSQLALDSGLWTLGAERRTPC